MTLIANLSSLRPEDRVSLKLFTLNDRTQERTRVLCIFGLSLESQGQTYTTMKPSGRFQTPSRSSWLPSSGLWCPQHLLPSMTTLPSTRTRLNSLWTPTLAYSSPDTTSARGKVGRTVLVLSRRFLSQPLVLRAFTLPPSSTSFRGFELVANVDMEGRRIHSCPSVLLIVNVPSAESG